MRTILFLVAFIASHFSTACCNGRSADIAYSLLTGTTYRIEVVTVTCLSAPTDMPEIQVAVDKGMNNTVPRTDIIDIPNEDIRRSTYTFEVDFDGSGLHIVDATIGGRGGGIVNIPNSISEVVCVRASILVDPMITTNSSIRFNTPPYVVTQNWNTFIHAPAPTDADNDSLSFEWVVPQGTSCIPINGYQFPIGINYAFVSDEDGTFSWDYPPFNGEYNLTIRGSEYRNGQLIGQVTRDMTICVVGFIAGVDDAGPLRSLTIAPNLTNDLIWIENPSSSPLPTAIHDARGKLVRSQTLMFGRTSIDLGQLPAGAYFVSATGATGQRFSGRVMKQ